MEERSPLPVLDENQITDPMAVLEQHLQPELFRALGDATRLEVLKRLITASTPQTVGDVADCCGVHLSGVSRHLAALRDAGVVQAERQGRQVLYRLDRRVLTGALRQLADAIDTCCLGSACCVPEPSGETP
ncbi:MAG: metalloregulator ArsR/SmtB family transcription factor [Acidobacteriota bacterium]